MALAALVAVSVFAHVAPSPDADNRYVKITLLPDHARVAYLVFFGETPGRAARLRMDTDRDGVLSPEEARGFGEAVRAEIAPAIALEIDGAPGGGEWTVADVGLGTPTVRGGAFSIDLVRLAPLARGRAEHTLYLADGWRPPTAGEAELRVEAPPEITLETAHAGREGRGVQTVYSDPTGGPLAVTVRFRAPVVAEPPPRSRTLPVAIALAIAVLLGGVWWWRRSR